MHALHLMLLAMLTWGTGRRDRAPVSRPPLGAPERRAGTLVMDTVHGVVFDSITNAPMSDAFVVAEPGGALTATTSEGRFILVSPARVRKISVYHDATEQLGIPGLVAIRPDPSAPWHDVRVATPSMSTLWARFCPGERPGAGRGGILFGSARRDDSSHVAGAHVSVQWRSTGAPSVKPTRDAQARFDSVRVQTDTVGKFVACGVPEFGEASVAASTERLMSGTVVIPSSERSLRRVDVLLGDITANGAHATAMVRGRVVDTAGIPVSNAVVALEGASVHTTGANGTFEFAAATTGSRMISVHKAGYRIDRRIIDVVSRGPAAVEVTLEMPATLVGGRVARGPISRRDSWELSLRRAGGEGRAVDSLSLARHRDIRSAIKTLGEFRASARHGTVTVHGAGGCAATLFVDGALDDPRSLAAFHRLAPRDLGMIEAFARDTDAPASFAPAVQPGCGVILAWTKAGLRQE